MNTQEVWKDVKNYEGIYQVSNLGRVKSLDRVLKGRWGKTNRKGVVLKQFKDISELNCVMKMVR